MKAISATVVALLTVSESLVSAQNVDATASGPNRPPAVAPSPAPSQIIYVPQLPTAQELTNAASAQGVEIAAIVDNRSQVTVTYKLANAQTNTVVYQVLPSAQAGSAQTVILPTSPAPAVVYRTEAPRVVYYTPPTYYPNYVYYPSRYWYSPVSLSLGFGLGYYGGYRSYGGYRGHGGYYGHGGFRGGGHRHYHR